MYICQDICVCVCVCVCACVKREREREREREGEGGGERVHVCCVKMRHLNASTHMYVYIVHNSTDSNAMLLPGRVPGYKESDVKLLASTIIKHTGGRVVVMKPMKDLYRICQQNSGTIMHLRIALKRRSQL